jgi:hypothetical protein
MAEKLSDKELVTSEELVMANTISLDAIALLLIEKGVFTEEEYLTKLKQVQAEYQNKQAQK